MGLFNNYAKPGPGVDKHAPQKKGIFRYFEMLFRKFWKLWQLNMITFILSLPFLIIMYTIAPVSDSFIISLIGEADESTLALMQLMFRSLFALLAFNLLGSGPASASYAYITRSFTREQHAWILSDFKDKFIENFKQSFILTILDIVLVMLIMNGIYFYYMQYINTASTIWLILCCLIFTLSVLYVFMHFHIYQMMVTFSSTTVQLFRNSFIFSLAQLPMNVFLAVIAIGLNVLVFNFFTPPFAIFLSFLITTSLVRFPIEYSSARAIEKKLLVNMPQPEKEEESFFPDLEEDADTNEGEE
ncbi:MAG: DUF624 domain-containing protein [Clostridia bacterium]|nr:DUF624 domain-containing protein [Clostridia bacterium]